MLAGHEWSNRELPQRAGKYSWEFSSCFCWAYAQQTWFWRLRLHPGFWPWRPLTNTSGTFYTLILSQHRKAPVYTAHTDRNKNKCFWGVLEWSCSSNFIILMPGKTFFLLKARVVTKRMLHQSFNKKCPSLSMLARSAAAFSALQPPSGW